MISASRSYDVVILGSGIASYKPTVTPNWPRAGSLLLDVTALCPPDAFAVRPEEGRRTSRNLARVPQIKPRQIRPMQSNAAEAGSGMSEIKAMVSTTVLPLASVQVTVAAS